MSLKDIVMGYVGVVLVGLSLRFCKVMGDNSRPSLFVETSEAVINSAKVGGALSIPACFMLSYATLKSAIEDVLDIGGYRKICVWVTT